MFAKAQSPMQEHMMRAPFRPPPHQPVWLDYRPTSVVHEIKQCLLTNNELKDDMKLSYPNEWEYNVGIEK